MRQESSRDLAAGGEGGSLLFLPGRRFVDLDFFLLEHHRLGGFDALGVGDK